MTRLLAFVLLASAYIPRNVTEYTITSQYLGYDVRYWVHVPDGYADQTLPVLYITDGKWYCNDGDIVNTSRHLIKEGKAEPHILVLVDAYDTKDASRNRRNEQFLCNPDYVSFYREELVPHIQEKFGASKRREDTGLLGVSFGGLNSMYFAVHAHDTFGQIGIQSPAPHPCPDVYDDLESMEEVPLDIYLSTGTVNDKARDTRRLKRILDAKGYDIQYQEVPEGHNWKNWKPLLDDVLIHFYGKEAH